MKAFGMDILNRMPKPDSPDAPVASWMQLEHHVERLHDAARAGLDVREFYRRLLADASSALGAIGGAAWRMRADGPAELICQVRDADGKTGSTPLAIRREAIERAAVRGEPEIVSNASSRDEGAATYDCLVCPVVELGAGLPAESDSPAAVFELWFAADAGPLVQQAWLDFARTIADVAADFHALDELRQLRESAGLHRQAVELLRHVQTPRDLEGAAFELANEGRRILSCDRLSVLIRRGDRWRLLSASGAARVQRRNDFTRRTERLAEHVARWGEPISYPADDGDGVELPPSIAAAIEDHVDHSHARELAAVPISFAANQTSSSRELTARRRTRERFNLVLVAENFEAHLNDAWRRQLIELGELCAPALARAAALDRFPIRTMLRWSDRLAVLTQPWRLAKTTLVVGAIAAAISVLAFVPADFDVEAPATLATTIERDVFATATGAVAEVRVEHGQMVKQGDVLVVLSDPELALKLQQTRGEIDATRKRLEALAVTRTDRALRENQADDRLPLSAEQRQLEERLASLEAQLKLLETRRDALALRSPLAGQVLTQDVRELLASRPVERGQALLTIADIASGWQLKAEVPQRKVGHLLTAQQSQSAPLAASLRLAGDVQKTYPGRVVAISAAAPLEPEGLEDEAPPVEVRIALEGRPPPAARPGMTASVRIHCGQRSLGYVWLHDVGATIYRWLTF